MTGTVQDITEIKYYQLALEESQGKLLEAQHIANLGNWVWDMKADLVELSSIGRRIFGIDQDDTLSIKDIFGRIHPDDSEEFRTKVAKARNGDLTGFYECRIVEPGQGEKYLQFRHIVSAYEDGKPVQMTGTIQDVSKIKYYQMELEENQRQLQTALNQEKILSETGFRLNRVDSFRAEIELLLCDTAEIIQVDQICFLQVDTASRSLVHNCCSRIGLGENNRKCMLIKHLMSIDGVIDCIDSKQVLALSNLDQYSGRVRKELKQHNIESLVVIPMVIGDQVRGLIVFSDGYRHDWAEDNVRFLETLAGVITSAWGRDTYYHARLEAERNQKESARLLAKSSRLASLGVLAGGIAHEISQPLNAIRLTADSFTALTERNMLDLPEKYLKRLRKLTDHVCRIDGIIQKMRYLWSPYNAAAKESYELNVALTRAASPILEQFSTNELNVEFDLASEPVRLFGNPLDIEQIVVNLLANSRDALMQYPADERNITISSTVSGNQVLLRFEDSGVGFQTTDMFKLFDPFYTTKKTQTSMGFGLAIVKKIVENNGGSIDASSVNPHGAAIEITLPIGK
jgi:signal transduction histidine kinase